jgi:hypothetical protein
MRAKIVKIITVAFVITCSALLIYLVDDGLGMGWPQNVVRNWQQFGLFKLRGQLVFNEGGFEALTRPEIFRGISPVSLYPPYAATELFGWTGLGTMSFHILLAAAVFWAIWQLLGRTNFAFVTATVVILTPGYLRWQKGLDPCTIPVLLSLPYIAIILSILRKYRLSVVSLIGLSALIWCFTSLNWSTAWVCGPCILLLWFSPNVERRKTIIFAALSAVSCAILGIISVKIKAGTGNAGSSNLFQFFLSYTWGDTGYGLNLTTGKAVLRLAFVNVVGLLPALVIFVYVLEERIRRQRRIWPSISPLALSVLDIAIMRNYFAHHPWLAAPVLLVGLILSLALLRTDNMAATEPLPLDAGTNRQNASVVASVFVCCFAYGLCVLFILRANEADLLSLVRLIRHDTGRSDLVVLVRNSDPQTVDLAPRLPEVLDRRVVVINQFYDLPAMENRAVILSSVPLNGNLRVLAQSDSGETKSRSWETKLADWFNESIARRRPGDRLNVAPRYFLYDVTAAH